MSQIFRWIIGQSIIIYSETSIYFDIILDLREKVMLEISLFCGYSLLEL